jgi:hypothetical protein
MSDEPEYTREQFVPSPRDELFHRARIGEITPKEAEAEAARQGWEPLASHPADDAFDPRAKSRWSLSMALAWILWRDFGEVREWDNGYREECWNWQPFNVRLPVDGGASTKVVRGFAVAQLHPTNSLLFEVHGAVALLADHTHPAPGKTPANAQSELWSALLDGKLIAEGVPATGGARVDVPAREWSDLENCTDGSLSGEYFRYRHHPIGRAYNDILWRRDDLYGLRPPTPRPPPGGQRAAQPKRPMPQTSLNGWMPALGKGQLHRPARKLRRGRRRATLESNGRGRSTPLCPKRRSYREVKHPHDGGQMVGEVADDLPSNFGRYRPAI